MASPEEYSEGFLRQSKQGLINSVSAVFIVLEVVCVALRFVSKRVGRLKLGWDDTFMILGLLFCIADAAATMADVKYGGIGLHEARVRQNDPQMMVTWGKFIIIIPLLYFTTVVPPKLAILHLYLSIFTHKALRYTCYGTGAVIILNWIAVIIAGLLSCQPLSYFWTQQGHCIDINAWLRWGGFANILTDVVMLILPIPVVLNLHASIRLRLGILITFLLGSLGLISSIIRFWEFYVTDSQGDKTWAASTLVIWAVIEGGIYLIAASLPTYRPLMKLAWRRARTRRGQTGRFSQPHTEPGGSQVKHSQKLAWVDGSTDEEDAVRLVTLGSHQHSDIGPGKIIVDHEFSVH
ncbi:integral membrane protein [Aspergillus sergii]|uniref:Integral membrane protein n=1 Tax=Aspergillus sergii TaxID=1034303 RepID=A0A5N6WSP7_9EURO|nr:integral membrane protein [Aspergillus sergii]